MSLDQLAAAADALRGTHIRRHNVESIRELLAPLIKVFQPTVVNGTPDHIWWRARKCRGGARFASLTELIYPPPEHVALGRANLAGEPTLYASWNESTAMEEIGARPGDMVQTIALRVREGHTMPLCIVGEFQSIHNSGGSLINSRDLEQKIGRAIPLMRKELLQKLLYVDAFLAELMRLQPKKSDDYLPTATFASLVHRKGLGLMFPSVENAHAVNLAVAREHFDATYEVIGTRISEISSYYGYGIYTSNVTSDSADFAASGHIDWSSKKFFLYRQSIAAGLKPLGEISGWRVPDTSAA